MSMAPNSLVKTSIKTEENHSYDKAGNNQNNNAVYNLLNNQMSENALYKITYDVMGNIKTKYNKLDKTLNTYTFNARNQLTSFTKQDENNNTTKTLTYTYDAFNRRVSKTDTSAGSATVTQKYLYDGDDIVAILDSSNAVIATITHDESIDTPLSITNANGTFYYHRDHQGSIVALTDSTGAVVESFTYDNHYGTIVNHTKTIETNNPYAYTGRELDTNDLYYYRARYYDPSLQRFLGEDPIGFRSGDFNFYRYVGSEPINKVDSWGLKECKTICDNVQKGDFHSNIIDHKLFGGPASSITWHKKCPQDYPNLETAWMIYIDSPPYAPDEHPFPWEARSLRNGQQIFNVPTRTSMHPWSGIDRIRLCYKCCKDDCKGK
jgi:RHS repeat-associated protein